jgi:hypothetical protein
MQTFLKILMGILIWGSAGIAILMTVAFAGTILLGIVGGFANGAIPLVFTCLLSIAGGAAVLFFLFDKKRRK